ncbi:MAG: translation initiation factor IF-2 [Mangrovibacterium sp.]
MTVGNNNTRLSKVAKEFNVGVSTIVEFLDKKGIKVDNDPNAKISSDAYHFLEKEYKADSSLKKESEKINLRPRHQKDVSLNDVATKKIAAKEEKNDTEIRIKDLSASSSKPSAAAEVTKPVINSPKVVGKIDLNARQKTNEEKAPAPTPTTVEKKPIINSAPEKKQNTSNDVDGPRVLGKIDLESLNQKTRPDKKTRAEKQEERAAKSTAPKAVQKPVAPNRVENHQPQTKVVESSSTSDESKEQFIGTVVDKLTGPKVLGKIELPEKKKPAAKGTNAISNNAQNKKKRRRIKKDTPGSEVSVNKPATTTDNTGGNQNQRPNPHAKNNQNRKVNAPNNNNNNNFKKKRPEKAEVTDEEVQQQIKDTLARLTSGGSKTKGKGAKYRRDKRDAAAERADAERAKEQANRSILKVTEFVTVADLATMMEVGVNQVIGSCMSLGLFVSINQRLDAETMALVAEEFGFKVEFVSAEILDAIVDNDDRPDEVHERAPIVTVMGHVDHGKTSLLDYIRQANVIAGEAGGITQHIGAYNVCLENGKHITFLDTPGHEAFTAMRARGAQITDIAIIIVAADDDIMPQTKEAINHAQAAGVPIIFAINKIDKPGANPDKIKQGLASMNFLIEEWGGKYQSQDISAKHGLNIEQLLEKVLLEAEMLELKANAEKRAVGTIIESSLDKGRGYVATVLVENGSLKQGDIILAGQYFGHIKAMFNERNQRVNSAGPAEPVIILGLNGAPQAGDKFNILDELSEARQIANKREQLAREQGLRTQKHITLDEIGRRIALGNFQELNLIVKGDVDGSIEALSDSLIKLSTPEIQINVIHKAVGAISESDVMLATASDAIVIGFQVRPTVQARGLAEKEEVDIRMYSIIYDAIEEIKTAMEGMLSPDIKEEILGTAEIMETFKITKVGTIAGCIVRDGKFFRTSKHKVRLIRDGIVIYTGQLGSLKRFKDDVKEVAKGYECGMNIDGYNDIKTGDFIECFHEVEVERKL